MRMTDLKPGWAVVDNEGRRFGTVKEVSLNYVLTSRAGLAGDLYVPASAIANIADEVIQLNLAGGEAEQLGWAQPPRSDDTLEEKPDSDLHRHV